MTETTQADRNTLTLWRIGLPIAIAIWIATYARLTDFADHGVDLLNLSRDTHLGDAVHFSTL